MKNKLILLESLQELDKTIDCKKGAQAAFHAEISTCEQELFVCKQTLEVEMGKQAVLEKQKAESEAALAAELENIKRSESHSKEIRTNKEFQAIGREISAAKKLVGELEEQILALTSSTEEAEAAIDVLKAECDSTAERCTAMATEKQSAIAVLQQEIDASSNDRDELLKQLSQNLVRRYYQLREQRRGQALAEVRGGSCLGCNMNLPPQLYNTLFRGEELMYCPHCQRILILKQEQNQ